MCNTSDAQKIFAELILVNGEIVEARKELRKVFLD